MDDTPEAPEGVSAVGATPTATPAQQAVRELAHARTESSLAAQRLQARIPITGFHGEDFEPRWKRVQQIVSAHHSDAVQRARERALQAGWTDPEDDDSPEPPEKMSGPTAPPSR